MDAFGGYPQVGRPFWQGAAACCQQCIAPAPEQSDTIPNLQTSGLTPLTGPSHATHFHRRRNFVLSIF